MYPNHNIPSYVDRGVGQWTSRSYLALKEEVSKYHLVLFPFRVCGGFIRKVTTSMLWECLLRHTRKFLPYSCEEKENFRVEDWRWWSENILFCFQKAHADWSHANLPGTNKETRRAEESVAQNLVTGGNEPSDVVFYLL